MRTRDKLLIGALVWGIVGIFAAIGYFVFGLPWWVAIMLAVIALVVNGWIAE